MNEPWLLIDVSPLAYRSMYTMGNLSHDGVQTVVMYGVMATVVNLEERFGTSRVAWCFDGGWDQRRKMYPQYKSKRRERNEEEQRLLDQIRAQVQRMEHDYLPSLGFRNVFSQSGYEADDVIASLCRDSLKGDSAIIVSGDEDLLQLLSPQVSIWQPNAKRLVNYQTFVSGWGLEPRVWAKVKAIAGCPGDGVIGVRGVGEITAAKYLRMVLSPDTKAYRDIVDARKQSRVNYKVVKLPLEGVKTFVLQEDQLDEKKWTEVMNRLGFHTIRRERRRLV